MSIGDNIRRIRKNQGLTMKELGEKIGVSEQAIGNYERGDRTPNINILNKIARALGATIAEIAGNKRTFTQEILDNLISQGLTLEQISKNAEIDINELNNMHNNSGDFTWDAIQKLGKYINSSDEKIAEWITNDTIINCTYNNDGSHPESEALRKYFCGEPLTLVDILSQVNDREEQEFLTALYNKGLLDYTDKSNTDDIKKSSNSSIIFTSDDLDLAAAHIEKLLQFMQFNDYPVNKLNVETVRYLYNKIVDLLDFEFYKLDKNNYQVPSDKI